MCLRRSPVVDTVLTQTAALGVYYTCRDSITPDTVLHATIRNYTHSPKLLTSACGRDALEANAIRRTPPGGSRIPSVARYRSRHSPSSAASTATMASRFAAGQSGSRLLQQYFIGNSPIESGESTPARDGAACNREHNIPCGTGSAAGGSECLVYDQHGGRATFKLTIAFAFPNR